jgi:hypothetical protein
MYIYIYIYINESVSVYVHVHVHMHLYLCACVYVFVYVCVYVNVCMYVYICIYIYIYIYIYINYIHTQHDTSLKMTRTSFEEEKTRVCSESAEWEARYAEFKRQASRLSLLLSCSLSPSTSVSLCLCVYISHSYTHTLSQRRVVSHVSFVYMYIENQYVCKSTCIKYASFRTDIHAHVQRNIFANDS